MGAAGDHIDHVRKSPFNAFGGSLLRTWGLFLASNVEVEGPNCLQTNWEAWDSYNLEMVAAWKMAKKSWYGPFSHILSILFRLLEVANLSLKPTLKECLVGPWVLRLPQTILEQLIYLDSWLLINEMLFRPQNLQNEALLCKTSAGSTYSYSWFAS